GRLDKYYHLAKEQGYRARSAFKLIQLNKKYEFLERARVLIDLCAAPGGWYVMKRSHILEEKNRRINRILIGCSVLHDGAPNVGAAWTQDAFTQSELVLVSLKLATEFLCKGGTFVTKVFRSKDYNKLMWVFQQLFRKVEATKPPSSRNVSAEIFVVCRDFIAPKKVDPRFLDPKTVFEEVDNIKPATVNNIFTPSKKTRQREGYEDGDYTLHKKRDAMEFITSSDPIAFLGAVNQIVFDSDGSKELLKKESTTDEIKENCNDLKVLGKREFKMLLKWRSSIREEYKMDKKEVEEVVVEEEDPLDEDEKLQAELENLSKEEAARRKREKRKANEKKMKNIFRMQMNMLTPTDIGIEAQAVNSDALFNIRKIDKDSALSALESGDMEIVDDALDEEDDVNVGDGMNRAALYGRIREMDNEDGLEDSDFDEELDAQLEEEYQRYKERRAEKDHKFRAKMNRQEQDEWHGFDGKNKKVDDDDSDSDSDDEASGQPSHEAEDQDDDESDFGFDTMADSDDEDKPSLPKKKTNFLLKDLGENAAMAKKTSSGLTASASLFFDSDVFHGIDGLDDMDEDDEDDREEQSAAEEETVPDVVLPRKRKAEDELSREEEENEGDSDFEIVKNDEFEAPSDEEMWDGREDENSKAVKKAMKTGLVTAEAVTLARQLANKEKSTTDLIDEGFTKEAFRDKSDLPSWFLDDENRHNKPHIPVTKEAVKALREKLKALDARPIKKIAEAKARKKNKAIKRLQKAQKKATDIADNPDLTEKEKVQTINRMLARATKSKPKKEIKLVVAKGANRGIKGRPAGVKGRYKMVDSRMKCDLRAQKRAEKKKKKKGRR
ncbi:Spb1 C-terminal domain-containing protein, partial [Dichotomocladium elegans]